jgi:hypothetical protein
MSGDRGGPTLGPIPEPTWDAPGDSAPDSTPDSTPDFGGDLDAVPAARGSHDPTAGRPDRTRSAAEPVRAAAAGPGRVCRCPARLVLVAPGDGTASGDAGAVVAGRAFLTRDVARRALAGRPIRGRLRLVVDCGCDRTDERAVRTVPDDSRCGDGADDGRGP